MSGGESTYRKKTEDAKRGASKAFVRVVCVLISALLVFCIAAAACALYNKTHYKITFYHETSDKISGGIRIAVISDIHCREYGERSGNLISDLRSLEPDLILFPGDMVIWEQDDYQSMLELVSAAAAIAPCYGVLGNHESQRIYFKDDRDLPEKFGNAGLRLLRNASEDIRVGDDKIRLTGVEGTSYGFEQYGGREFMDNAETDPGAYSIVMAHIPILFKEQLSVYDFDLGIAGHVHGGIVRIPFIGGLYSHEEGLFPEFSAGEYVLNGRQTLIVSAGLGDSKVFPPRINNTPELVIIDVNRQ